MRRPCPDPRPRPDLLRRASLVPALALLALLAACGGGGSAEPGAEPLRVLTRNLYYGADLDDAILAVSEGDGAAIVGAVTQVRASLAATDFATRAAGLALEIEQQRPDLVGLQEAALWRVQSPSDAFEASPTPATEVAYDLVELLLQALAARGLAYDVVVVSEGFDVEMPFVDEVQGLSDLRLTDREVILARRDLAQDGRVLQNPDTGRFTVNLVLADGFEAVRGWASVEVREGARVTRFVTTHLEAEVPAVRDAQATELLGGPLATALDVVLVGDLNDDAGSPTPGGPYAQLTAQGFADAWHQAGGAGPGATCCFDALLSDPAAPLTERLDVVLVRGGLSAVRAVVVGADPGQRPGGLWPSDHAGLSAALVR